VIEARRRQRSVGDAFGNKQQSTRGKSGSDCPSSPERYLASR
jgi:hypothetical protein